MPFLSVKIVTNYGDEDFVQDFPNIDLDKPEYQPGRPYGLRDVVAHLPVIKNLFENPMLLIGGKFEFSIQVTEEPLPISRDLNRYRPNSDLSPLELEGRVKTLSYRWDKLAKDDDIAKCIKDAGFIYIWQAFELTDNQLREHGCLLGVIHYFEHQAALANCSLGMKNDIDELRDQLPIPE